MRILSFSTAYIIFSLISVSAQPVQIDISADDNFQTYAEKVNQYFADHPATPGYKQWKRKEWFLEPRLYAETKPRNFMAHTIAEYQKYIRNQPGGRSTHGDWLFYGPTSIVEGDGGKGGNGRINSIDFDPNDPDNIYVGTSNGGIWKSVNDGNTWTNISPNLPLLAIADIEISPTNSNIIYVLTGDGDALPDEDESHSQAQVSSIGVIRSTDGGSSWYPTGFSHEHPSTVQPIKLLMHPTNHNIQFACGRDGVHKTTNGWNTHSMVYGSAAYDIEFQPGDPEDMYMSGSTWIRKSIDMGETWDQVTDPDFSFGGTTRIELAVSPDLASVVYALAGNWSELTGFYRSLTSGFDNTWTLMDDTTTSMGKFATYCIALQADPEDYSDVFGGMQFMHRNLNQGNDGQWERITNGVVHADIHDVQISNGKLYVAADGGIYRSSNDGDTWTNISPGLAIMEIYRVSGTPQSASLQYCGAQDNGINRRTGNTAFECVASKDGMVTVINYNNSDTVIGATQNGAMVKSVDGGESFTSLAEPGGEGSWISPIIMDPIDPEIIFLGKTDLYRSIQGAEDGTWVNIGSPWTGTLNCLAQGTSNRNRLYASAGSTLFKTDNALVANGAATWTQINSGLPGLFITGIAVDPENSARLFVTLSGYTDGEKVYFSFNEGSTWTNITGSLPNIPANCIAYDPNGASDAIYIGTDYGVFYRDLDLNDWIFYSQRLPAVMVTDLYINTGNSRVLAGTYGRGMWASVTYSGCTPTTVLSTPGGIPIEGRHHYSVTDQITSSAEYAIELGTETVYRAGNRIILQPGFRTWGDAFFDASIGPCPAIFEPRAIISPVFPNGRWMD